LEIEHLTMVFAQPSGEFEELKVTLAYTEKGAGTTIEGEASTVKGMASTRSASASAWTLLQGKSPVGTWELTLANSIHELFVQEKIEDVVFVITFSGMTPEYPV
jgi:hypothetical protein